MSTTAKEPFDVVRACDLLPRPSEEAWLVEGLWSEQAVGIVGGEPKCGKSFYSIASQSVRAANSK